VSRQSFIKQNLLEADNPAGLTNSHRPKVHFIGIGGIGMSALARWYFNQKWAVTGSDIVFSPILRDLEKEGLKIEIGHKKANLRLKPDLVIYNQAISASNPELKEAKKRGIKTLVYPEALGNISRRYQKTIAIAGAHGKSTTTALLSLVLVKAGFNPTVILGTLLKEFNNKNFRAGGDEYFVIEADEWKASFLNYSPTFAIITNIDREHLDFYKNFENIKRHFLKFIGNIRPGGVLVANKDDKNLYNLESKIRTIAKRKNFKVVWYGARISRRIYYQTKRVLQIPGEHNVSNALAVYALAREIGINKETVLEALGNYRGAWRRMEYKGELRITNKVSRGQKNSTVSNSKFIIPVYDDYAHHPTEIKATLQAFKEKFPDKEIICVFQPHQAERLRLLFEDFVKAFNEADYLILLPIYKVVGRDKSDSRFTSKTLTKAISAALNENSRGSLRNLSAVIYLANPKNLKRTVRRIIHNSKSVIHNYVLIMMGAGDIVKYTRLLLI